MTKKPRAIFGYVRFLFVLLCLPFGLSTAVAAKPILDAVYSVPPPGNPTRLDYQSLDSKTKRLFIAHLGDSSVIVFDTKNKKVVAELRGIASVHGVLAV